uniref:CCHC-type domain-containing protein n=1 Tax=Glossina pallidipes TaxID=7398 RepID=A0A1A9Z291_GLOPL
MIITIPILCNKLVTTNTCHIKTSCEHYFHKNCFNKYIEINSNCDQCDVALTSNSTENNPNNHTQMITRQQKRNKNANLETEALQSEQTISVGITDEESRINRLVTAAVTAQRTQLFDELKQQMTTFIQSTLGTTFKNFNAQDSSMSTPNFETRHNITQLPPIRENEQIVDQLLGINSLNINELNSNHGYSNYSNNTVNLASDKIGQIIYNWKIRFRGGLSGLSVEAFLYRIEALTRQMLGGDFNLLCRHASILLDSKAADWFWRYHRSVPAVKWSELSVTLKAQYRDTRTDMDYRELCRDRKQKSGESFDSFYESILQLVDCLDQPIPEVTLVEILQRNLLPQIQQEILHLQVYSVAHLREICRKRELFMQDMTKKNLNKPSSFQNKYVSEINKGDRVQDDNKCTGKLDELGLVCWNCQKTGHRYHDCFAE